MSLGVGIVAIRHGEEISLQEAEHLIEVVFIESCIHVAYHRAALVGIFMHVIGQKTFHQSCLNLTIGDVEFVVF